MFHTVADKLHLKPSLPGLIFCILLILLVDACAPDRPFKRELIPNKSVDSMNRADPGYMQYLHKLSMLGKSQELAAIVSGSSLGWRVAGSSQNYDDLLSMSAVWVRIHPQNVLAPMPSSPLSQLGGPIIWNALEHGGIGGIYLAPTGGSGSLWDYERERIYSDNEDVAQYDMALYLGKDDVFKDIVRSASSFHAFVGGDLVPAATGVGPDFFLAVRDFRNYAGTYCLVEVPREHWAILPDVASEWELKPLKPSQTKTLEEKGLIPSVLNQETLSFLPGSGWGATSEVRGADAKLRRWVYRYFGNYKRPVLNWADPSATARQVFSGSVVRQVGLLGNALNGFNIQPFIGLERYGQSFRHGAADAGSASLNNYTQAMEAAINISRQVRSYGGWSWLRDELPLAILRDFLQVGPDFAFDSVTSPAAEHALLSGNAALLRFMVDEALDLGLDFKRLVHSSAGHEGVSYLLPHLQYLKSQQPELQNEYMRQDRDLRARAMVAEKFYALTLEEVAASRQSYQDNLPEPEISDNRLYTTPAGLAAAALGLSEDMELTEANYAGIAKGHQLLVFFKAMQPGLFMPSGQDLVGLLPLSKNVMFKQPEKWQSRMASMGTYSLLSSSAAVLANAQGLPKAKSLYGPIDMQGFSPDSFLLKLGSMLRLRENLGLKQGEIAGRLATEGRGLIGLAVKIPEKASFVLVLTNFSQSASHESIDTTTIPGLEQALIEGKVSLVHGNLSHAKLTPSRLEFDIAGCEGAVLVVEK